MRLSGRADTENNLVLNFTSNRLLFSFNLSNCVKLYILIIVIKDTCYDYYFFLINNLNSKASQAAS